MVVARNRQNAPVACGARCIGVLEHIHAAIDPGPFGVPHAEHAVVSGAREKADLLRSPNRCCGEVFVHARLKADMMLLKLLPRLP